MKIDVYQHVTDKIVAALEAGNAPWRKYWAGNSGGEMPQRANGQYYQGINTLILWCESMEKGFSSNRWFTFKQAKGLGASVRKGEKSTIVVFFSTLHKDADGKTVSPDAEDAQTIPYLKSYRVFNADQIDDLPAEYAPEDVPADGFEAHSMADCEAFVAATGADVRDGGTQAFYDPADDYIQMPPMSRFFETKGYYATLMHELVHWSGGSKRLDRINPFAKKPEYAFEELVAEIGSCFVCHGLGLSPDYPNHAAYLNGWLTALKNDKKYIFRAAAKAQAAANFLADFSTNKSDPAPEAKPVSVSPAATIEPEIAAAAVPHRPHVQLALF